MVPVKGVVTAQFTEKTGTLEPGKAADLVAISLERTRHPLLDPDMPLLESFLARAQGSDVRLSMVEGRILYDHGKFPHLDLSQLEQAAVRSACNATRPC